MSDQKSQLIQPSASITLPNWRRNPGRWLASLIRRATVRLASKIAATELALARKNSSQEISRNNTEWKSHCEALVKQGQQEQDRQRRQINELSSSLKLLEMERDALLGIINRDRERIEAETSAYSAKVAINTSGAQSNDFNRPQ